MFDFSGQTAIVTGGTRGIGRGIVKAFLKAGANVIATYAGNESAAEELRQDCLEFGDSLDIKRFDVANPEDVESFYGYVKEAYDAIEILINNSGIRKDNMLPMMPHEEWQRVIDVNLGGCFNMTKGALEFFRRKKYGRIVNISSIGGSLGLPGQANYAASKAGMVALSKSVSKEMGKRGITINNVCPGFIDTELISDLSDELKQNYINQVPARRFGTVEEVASAVLFLSSKEAGYINAASLDISGGL